MSYGSLYNPAYTPGIGSKPRFQTTHPFRNLVAAGTNMNNQWSGGSGHSGYGLDSPDYDYHSGPPAHIPSGGSYGYQATTGTGYGPPAQPVHHPVKPPTGGGGKKGTFAKNGSSAMSALTLLSFLFFINLLQGCIKDHMDAINPTVMVMTTNVVRNRLNKMGEMNSREHNSISSSTFTSNAAGIEMQPADLVVAQSPAVMEDTTVKIQSPYSVNTGSYNKPAPPRTEPQYTHNIPGSDVPVNHAKPSFDSHQSNPFEYPKQHLQPEPGVIYANHSLSLHSSPYNDKEPQMEHHYNYHHTEYHAQPPSSSAAPQLSQHTSNRYAHYEYQHPPSSNHYNDDSIAQYSAPHENIYQHKQEMQPTHHQTQSFQNSPTSQNSYPWSSHSSSSSSIVSGPFRRASIISVSPTTKWITIPAQISDHANFEEAEEEKVELHDDRRVFHRRLN